jgi:hypothetical protein
VKSGRTFQQGRREKADLTNSFPAFSRRGARAIKPLETPGRGGYQGIAKRTFFAEVTNRPVCAAKEQDNLLMAQPPRLGKAGNVNLDHF